MKPGPTQVHVDGGCSGNGSGHSAMYYSFAVAGQVIDSRVGVGPGTNNQAEYIALIRAARYVVAGHPVKVVFKSDSALLVNQVAGRWKINNAELARLRGEFLNIMRESSAEWKVLKVDRQEIVAILGH